MEELLLLGGGTAARISCDSALIPSPGRYVLAHEPASAALLATALFLAQDWSAGFIAAPPIHSAWIPGSALHLRGPLGHGFAVPPQARRVALVSMDNAPARLFPVAEVALSQKAAVTLVCDDPPDELPLSLEIQPQRALGGVCAWCDYAAYDVEQRSLEDLLRQVRAFPSSAVPAVSQILVRAPMPCGGLAACGVCSIRTLHGDKLACLDGPVFDLTLLLGRS